MSQKFKNIVIYGRQRVYTAEYYQTIEQLKKYLLNKNCQVTIELETAKNIQEKNLPIISFADLDTSYDLLVVIGGDGSMLNAALSAAKFAIPVVGINRGRLGFLADIAPGDLQENFDEILLGKGITETRFMLEATIEHKRKKTTIGCALNDVVLLPGHVSHMIEFAIYIDGQAVCSQRADGLITATPTGSTAYALSGGGPILNPQLDAIVMVPMFPHTLSSRPLVVDCNSKIKIAIDPNSSTKAHVSYDGNEHIPLSAGDYLHINKFAKPLTLIHPPGYNYYETLRSKLGWQRL